MFAPVTPTAADRLPRRRCSIPLSLRVFAAMLVLIAVASAYSVGLPACRHYAAMREIRRADGSVLWSSSVGPRWIRNLIGDDIMEMAFDDIEEVRLSGTQVTDATLQAISGVPKVREVWLCNTRVSNAGLIHLKGLPKLRRLFLIGTPVTDDWLVCLRELKRLGHLTLGDTQITDAALEHFKALPNLEHLYLYDTRVTDEGANELARSLPGLWIHRSRSDDGRTYWTPPRPRGLLEPGMFETNAGERATF